MLNGERFMRKIILILLLTVVFPSAWGNAQQGDSEAPILITGHPDRPPFIYRDGDQIVGLGPEFAGIVLSNLEVAYESHSMGPWKRVQEFARQGKVDLIAGLYRNSQRETYLAFTIPFMEDPTSVFVKKEKAFAISTRQDLVGWRGVTLFGDSFGEQMDRFMDNQLRMIRVYAIEDMFDLVLSEKADYMIFGHYAGRVAAIRMGLENVILVAKKNLVVEKVYFALSKKSPHLYLLDDINRQICKLREEGVVDALIEEQISRYRLKAY